SKALSLRPPAIALLECVSGMNRLAGGNMRKILGYGGLVLMFTFTGGEALAATGPSRCVGSDDVYALRAAAVQQRLMVAALTCHATDRYNQFVISYRKDLQASDLALQKFF